METHYVCKSCRGVSDHVKNCETDSCPLNGHPLEECHCQDGKHGMEPDVRLAKLRKFNLFMALLHAAQGGAIVWLSTDFKLPVNVGFLQFDAASQSLIPATETLFNLPIAWLVAGFLAISAVAHLIIATVYNRRYNANLQLGINKARWWEYGISASVMMVAIAMLVGIYDLTSLLMIFALVAIMNLTGLAMEVYNQGKLESGQKPNWLAFKLGTFAGVIPWLVVAIWFWAASRYGSGEIPTFVYWIYVSIFVFFNCFAINMILQYKRIGKWADYLYGERAYIILSLVAKSLLAWQVFAGTLRP